MLTTYCPDTVSSVQCSSWNDLFHSLSIVCVCHGVEGIPLPIKFYDEFMLLPLYHQHVLRCVHLFASKSVCVWVRVCAECVYVIGYGSGGEPNNVTILSSFLKGSLVASDSKNGSNGLVTQKLRQIPFHTIYNVCLLFIVVVVVVIRHTRCSRPSLSRSPRLLLVLLWLSFSLEFSKRIPRTIHTSHRHRHRGTVQQRSSVVCGRV